MLNEFQKTLKETLKDQSETQDIGKLNEIVVKTLSEASENHREVNTRTSNKLSEENLDLMKKRKNLQIKTNRDNIEVLKLNKIISKKQREDIQKYNMKIIEETVDRTSKII